LAAGDPATVLVAHVGRFNEAVRSGDFTAMVAGFTPDAEMAFEGVPTGPFTGRDGIADAYAAHPPTDQVRLLGARGSPAMSSSPTMAGQPARGEPGG
jgi:hypothetical protein